MKRMCYLLPLVCSVPVLIACSTAPRNTASAMRIEPLLSIRNSDSSARGYYQLGRYYQGQKRYEQAAESYRTALRLQADNIEAHSALGKVYALQGKYDAAVTEFSTILNITPQLAHVYNNLGYAYYLQGNYVDALGSFAKAIALEPNNARAYQNLGASYQKMGNEEQARLAFSRATKLNAGSAETTAFAAVTPATLAGHAEQARLPALTTVSVQLAAPTSVASVALGTDNRNLAASGARRMPVTLPALAQSDAAASAISPQSNSSVVRDDSAPGKLMPATAPTDKALRLEIANGNGITGLARKVRETLVLNGFPRSHLSNLKPYQQRRTVIQYRDGFYAEAVRLNSTLMQPSALVSNNELRASTDVRLVLGKDVASQAAFYGPHDNPIQLSYRTGDIKQIAEGAMR